MKIIENKVGKYRYFPCKSQNKKGNIIFIHGYATNSFYHDSFIESSTSEFDYYTLELPGHGFMEYNYDRVNISNLVNYCIQLINSFNINSFYLIGHSMGGGIAVRVANALKNKIKALVVVTPMNSHLSVLQLKNYFKFTPKTLEKTTKLINTLYNDARNTIGLEYFNDFVNKEYEYQQKNRIFFVKLKNKMFSLKNLIICRKNEKKLELPMLSFAGKFDSVIPQKSVYKSFKKNKNNKFVLFEKSAHIIFQEETELYNKTILDFFMKN